MKAENILTLSTSPPPLPVGKPRLTPRFLYGRTRRHFTGKGPDAETGLYYYGARYLDPRAARWAGGDPALGEYIPAAGRGSGGLPGMGGVFNTVNLHAYHYAGNNPVKYVDPDGREIQAEGDDGITYTWDDKKNQFYSGHWYNKKYGSNDEYINKVHEALVYLKRSSYGKYIINKVSASNNLAKIRYGDYTKSTVEERGRNAYINISFNDLEATDLMEAPDSFMSPAVGLFHEISHAHSHIVEGLLFGRKNIKSVPDGYQNLEELNAVAMTNRVAGQLGEPIRERYDQARLRYVGAVTDYLNGQVRR